VLDVGSISLFLVHIACMITGVASSCFPKFLAFNAGCAMLGIGASTCVLPRWPLLLLQLAGLAIASRTNVYMLRAQLHADVIDIATARINSEAVRLASDQTSLVSFFGMFPGARA